MKKFKLFIFTIIVLTFVSTVVLNASSGGITGRTLKSSANGCGGCHGSASTPDVTVSIAGPDSVNTGQTVQYTLTITRASKTGAGLNIATRSGTLAAVSSTIHASNTELTHNANINMTNGTITVTFSYTAPGTPATDTIWATGLATNSTGGTDGDDWNWAPSKRVIVRIPFGVTPVSTEIPYNYSLAQNYPNPFNPTTRFNFSLPKSDFVSVKIYNINGTEINSLVNGILSAGVYSVDWNSKNSMGEAVSSGVYFYALRSGNYFETKKMILAR